MLLKLQNACPTFAVMDKNKYYIIIWNAALSFRELVKP